MRNKLLFIIGIRRSGTSILRELVMRHQEIEQIEFEPHELLYVCSTRHIKRYRNSKYHQDVLLHYKQHLGEKWYGAKIALNVGIEALHWKWLDKKFKNCRFVFIVRNLNDTYNSWNKVDAQTLRGIVSKQTYKPFYNHIIKSFQTFNENNRQRSCIIEYEKLIENADNELLKAWKILELSSINGANQLIHKPENWRS